LAVHVGAPQPPSCCDAASVAINLGQRDRNVRRALLPAKGLVERATSGKSGRSGGRAAPLALLLRRAAVEPQREAEGAAAAAQERAERGRVHAIAALGEPGAQALA